MELMVYVIHRSEPKPVGKIWDAEVLGRVFLHRHSDPGHRVFDAPMGLDAVVLDLLEEREVDLVVSERSDHDARGLSHSAQVGLFRNHAVRRILAGRDRYYLPAKFWTPLPRPLRGPWITKGIVLDPSDAHDEEAAYTPAEATPPPF